MWALFGGWLLNHLDKKFTARNQIFGVLELLVSRTIQRYVLGCQSFLIMCLIEVWEIVAQSEPHIDVDPLDIGPLIRYA
jgi:hypothetical protein